MLESRRKWIDNILNIQKNSFQTEQPNNSVYIVSRLAEVPNIRVQRRRKPHVTMGYL